MFKKLKNLLFVSLASVLTLTSCKGGGDKEWESKFFFQPQVEICAATPYSDEHFKPDYPAVAAKAVNGYYQEGTDCIVEAELLSLADGDTGTFKVKTSATTYQSVKVRFACMDTAEMHHPTKGCEPWGAAGLQYTEYRLKNVPEGQKIIIEFSGASTYERVVGAVWAGEHFLAGEMLEIGLALPTTDTETKYDPRCREALNYRSNEDIYPCASDYGSSGYGYHLLQAGWEDPNWDYEKENGTNGYETSPCVKDKNFKYTFNWNNSGKQEEIKYCQDNPGTCSFRTDI